MWLSIDSCLSLILMAPDEKGLEKCFSWRNLVYHSNLIYNHNSCMGQLVIGKGLMAERAMSHRLLEPVINQSHLSGQCELSVGWKEACSTKRVYLFSLFICVGGKDIFQASVESLNKAIRLRMVGCGFNFQSTHAGQ